MTALTQVSVDDAVPAIHITREFHASVADVFRAHVDPELFVRWIGPDRLTTSIDHYDCRTGGSYRYVQHEAEGEYAFFGSFHEVRPQELIVQTFTFEGFPDGVSLETQRFVAMDGGRSRLEATSLVGTFQARDAMVSSGMEEGVSEGYAKLDSLLAS